MLQLGNVGESETIELLKDEGRGMGDEESVDNRQEALDLLKDGCRGGKRKGRLRYRRGTVKEVTSSGIELRL